MNPPPDQSENIISRRKLSNLSLISELDEVEHVLVENRAAVPTAAVPNNGLSTEHQTTSELPPRRKNSLEFFQYLMSPADRKPPALVQNPYQQTSNFIPPSQAYFAMPVSTREVSVQQTVRPLTTDQSTTRRVRHPSFAGHIFHEDPNWAQQDVGRALLDSPMLAAFSPFRRPSEDFSLAMRRRPSFADLEPLRRLGSFDDLRKAQQVQKTATFVERTQPSVSSSFAQINPYHQQQQFQQPPIPMPAAPPIPTAKKENQSGSMVSIDRPNISQTNAFANTRSATWHNNPYTVAQHAGQQVQQRPAKASPNPHTSAPPHQQPSFQPASAFISTGLQQREIPPPPPVQAFSHHALTVAARTHPLAHPATQAAYIAAHPAVNPAPRRGPPSFGGGAHGGAMAVTRGSGGGKRYIGVYSPEARQKRIQRFLEKRKRRVWSQKVQYDVRKVSADVRPRYRGRFIKPDELARLKEEGKL
mmetsp:Transcript_34864/g.60295  ORF Transcript_34864/g.60295 Transcript_34864/m.60295 type:complete len:473 (-) Transcript_34864:566-1984(-)